MPHLDMIGSGNFSFPENEYNVSPFSKSAMKFAHTVQTVSLTAIAAACQMDRENVATLLKAIFVKFVSYRKANSSSLSSLLLKLNSHFSLRSNKVDFRDIADLI